MFRFAGRDAAEGQPLSQAVTASILLPAHGEADLEIAYRSRGLDDWTYAFAPEGVSHVEDFTLDMTTDFGGIDFPAGTVSPITKSAAGAGWRLGWRFDSLVTGQKIGLDLPNRLNPGPVAARITFFAPVSLLFFLTVMVILGVLSGRSLHPMNYFFLSAAFFAFHMLLAYLVDHTGLTVTLGAVATLFVLMQITAKVDWAEVFARPDMTRAPSRPA